jgi:phosphonate transport system substrate-binding protein
MDSTRSRSWISPAALAVAALAAGVLPAAAHATPATAPAQPPPSAPVATTASSAPLKLLLPSPLGVERARSDAAQLAKLFTSLLQREVVAEVAPNAEIAAMLASGKADLGWLSAAEYLEASRLSGGRVAPVSKLLRGGLPFYRSALFTLKWHKKLISPASLKGKKLAFVRPDSAAGYLLPRQILLAAGLTEAELKEDGTFYGDHAAVCAAVAAGKAEAGATFSNDRAGGLIAGCSETLGQKTADLKVLAVSDPIPNDLIVVRPGYPLDGFAALRTALDGLRGSAEGKRVLEEVFHSDAFVASDDGEFDLLREALK